jgi:N4-gp56 family major capsid protein
VWKKKFFREFVRENRFNKYMGSDASMPIQLLTDLTKDRGDTISVPLITKLKSGGVTGGQTLLGNEEALNNLEDRILVDKIRNGVLVNEMEQQRTEIELLDAARPALMDWAKEKLRDDLIGAMYAPNLDGKTLYANCTEPQKNAWLAANADRILFGSQLSNSSSLVHATALATVDSTNDKLSAVVINLAKRLAVKTTNVRAMRPIKVNDDEEWYVLLCSSLAFRDLQNDATIAQVNRDARVRGTDNPLFTGGDLMYNGVIIREVPEIPVITGVGTAGIDVAACFLLGAQALGVAWAKRTNPISETTDYGDKEGVGVEEIRGLKKLMYDNKQHGMMTIYVSAVADG